MGTKTWEAWNDGFPMPDDNHPAARPRLNRIRGMLALFQLQADALRTALKTEMETEAVFMDESLIGGDDPCGLCIGPIMNEIDRQIHEIDLMANRTMQRVGRTTERARFLDAEASSRLVSFDDEEIA